MAEDDLFKSLRDEFSSPKTHAAPGHIVDLREGSAPGWVMEEKEEPVPPAPPLPAPPMVFDPDARAPDLLNRNLIRSLQRDAEILELPFDVDDPKTNNLIVTTSSSTKMAAIKVDENRLRAERQPEALERVLARIAQLIEEKKTAAPAPMPLVTVIEEPPVEKSFEAFHKLHDEVVSEPEPEPPPVAPEPPQYPPEVEHTQEPQDPRAARQRYERTGIKPPVPAKDSTPAPGPVSPPELSEIEHAMRHTFDR